VAGTNGRIYGTKIHNLVTSDEWLAPPSPTSSFPCLVLRKLDGRALRWGFYVNVHGLMQGRCRLAMCRSGGEGDFEHQSVGYSCRRQSSVGGRSCSMEERSYAYSATTTGSGGGYWDIGPRLLSALMVFCVTSLVLYCTVLYIQYRTYPRRKRDHHHRLSRVRSLSLHLLPQEEIEDAACCEAEPWMHRYCIVFDGKDAGA
jgi:hypothetical protein